MFVKLGNLTVHYKVAGSGAAILLLHGWGSDTNYFAKLQQYLSHRFTVYAMDLPGFGLSTQPEEVWGGNEYANLVVQFINATKILTPILIGHSFGGKIVINVVANNLVNAKKIVLISSAGVKLPRSFKTVLRIYCFKLIKSLVNLPIIKDILGARFELYRKKFGSTDYRNASGLMRKILVNSVNEDITALLPRIKVPALLIWGDKDDSTPLKAGQIMQQLIPQCELQVFSGSGHFLLLDNYERVVSELDRFL